MVLAGGAASVFGEVVSDAVPDAGAVTDAESVSLEAEVTAEDAVDRESVL